LENSFRDRAGAAKKLTDTQKSRSINPESNYSEKALLNFHAMMLNHAGHRGTGSGW